MKDKLIKFRCSASEKSIIISLANRTGLSTSHYCRQQILKGKVYAIPKLTAVELEYFRMLKEERKN